MISNTDAAGLWALAPVSVKPLGGGKVTLLRRDNGAVATLDAQWRPFLGRLHVFRTLQGHAASIAGSVPSLRGRELFIRRGLETLIPSGVLVHAAEILDRLETGPGPNDHRGPVTLVITTCDRPECLERLLRSLARNREAFGGDWSCEVIDDSRANDSRRRNAELVAAAASRFPATYFGLEDQEAFIDGICEQVPAAAEHLPWLLSGRHPDHADAATYGVPVNLALLRHAGARIVLVDDDTVVNPWIRPDAEGGIRFDNHTAMPWVLTNGLEGAARRLQRFGEDPVAAHGASLGASVREVLGSLGKPGGIGESLAGADYRLVTLLDASSRVRFTQNGLLGDPGTMSDLLVFMPGSEFLKAGAIDDDGYREFLQAPRCVFTGQRWPALRNTLKFQRATFAGMDLDPYMAPVLPHGRGEDAMIGALARFLYPRDLRLRLAFGLEHRPDGGREWAIAPQTLAYHPSAVEMVTQWIAATGLPVDFCDPADRMDVLARTLRAALARGGGADILHRTAARYRELLVDYTGALKRSLAMTPNGCDAWKKRVTDVLEFAAGELRNPPPEKDAATAQELERVARYAAAVPAWNRAFALCRDNRAISP
jgi:hypothetical protein